MSYSSSDTRRVVKKNLAEQWTEDARYYVPSWILDGTYDASWFAGQVNGCQPLGQLHHWDINPGDKVIINEMIWGNGCGANY